MIAPAKTSGITAEWVGITAKQVESRTFGVVQITVHEARGGSQAKGEVTAADEKAIFAGIQRTF